MPHAPEGGAPARGTPQAAVPGPRDTHSPALPLPVPAGIAARVARPRSAPPPPTLADLVAAQAQWRPERTALIDDAGEHTYGALHLRVTALARGLRALGVHTGDPVAVAEDPCADMVALYLATARIGAVLVPLSTRLTAAELAVPLGMARPVLAAGSAERAEVLSAALDHCGADTTMLTGGEDTTWADCVAAAGAALPAGAGAPDPEVGPDSPHLLLFTSGTTGAPKAAVLSQRRSLGDAFGAALASGVRPDDRLLAYQPLYHTGGWDFLKQYLLAGGSAVLMRKFDPDTALALIERHRCTSLFAVPLVLARLLDAPRLGRTDLASLRRLMYASYEPSRLVPRAVAAFEERGARDIRLEHVYGQTEAGSFIATLRPEDAVPDTLDAVGTPVPGVTVALLDPALRPVQDGRTGEVCVRGESVMLGYLDDPGATAAAFEGGWLHTGDLGVKGADGQLRIVGRLRDMVRTAGENVFPKEVEAALVEHPEVLDCAVFGVPDEEWDERVAALVVRASGSTLTEDALTAHLRARLAGFKLPRTLRFVAAIPKTPAGKTDRKALPGRLAADPAPSGQVPGPSGEVAR
ncbi:class I adenylate-forming enzyme family protein [Streptomyces sp. NPDC050560]|uniref:class I adenylate-forming enzyme family protein n=1 Tax=Streptomyces sp. NPDC050560 TaxID=3365630 RepID=UPI00378CDE17